jgi:hypothetical protein
MTGLGRMAGAASRSRGARAAATAGPGGTGNKRNDPGLGNPGSIQRGLWRLGGAN